MPLVFEEIIFTMKLSLVVVKNSLNVFGDKEQPLNVKYKKNPLKG